MNYGTLKNPQKGRMWTYIATDLSHTYKIGQSTDIEKRISDLAIGNPNLRLVFTIQADVESRLHKTFKDKNYFGEWFTLSKDDIKRIQLEYARYIISPEEDKIAQKHRMNMGTCMQYPLVFRKKAYSETVDFFFSFVVQHLSSNCFVFGLTRDISTILDRKAHIRGGILLGYARGNWYKSGVTLKTDFWGGFSNYVLFKRYTGKQYRFVKEER